MKSNTSIASKALLKRWYLAFNQVPLSWKVNQNGIKFSLNLLNMSKCQNFGIFFESAFLIENSDRKGETFRKKVKFGH